MQFQTIYADAKNMALGCKTDAKTWHKDAKLMQEHGNRMQNYCKKHGKRMQN